MVVVSELFSHAQGLQCYNHGPGNYMRSFHLPREHGIELYQLKYSRCPLTRCQGTFGLLLLITVKPIKYLSIYKALLIHTNTIQYIISYVNCYKVHLDIGCAPTVLLYHILLQLVPWYRQGAHCTAVPYTATACTLIWTGCPLYYCAIYCYRVHPDIGCAPTVLLYHILLQCAPWYRQGAHCTIWACWFHAL